MVFICFLIWGFFFHFIALVLSPSGLGYDGFFLFFDLGPFFPFYCLWFKFVGCRLLWNFFCFLIWAIFFYFIAFGLSPSGLGYDGFLLFFYLGRLFPFYCLWFKSVGFRLWWIFFFLIWSFLFHFIAFGLSSSGLGYDGFYLCFDLGLLFPFYYFSLTPSGLGYDGFFLKFDLGLVFPFYCLWFKSVLFRLW